MQGSVLLAVLVFWPMLAATLGYLIGRRDKTARDRFVGLATALECLLAVILLVRVARGDTLGFSLPGLFGFGLNLELDGFRAIYALITAFMWMMTGLFSRDYFAHYRNRNRYYLFCLLTLGATAGIFLSADLITCFAFFEVMSLTSYAMVAHDEKPATLRAAGTYLAVAVIGGLVMLMGLFLLHDLCGTLIISELYTACKSVANRGLLYLIGALLMVGFGAKAGMFPLHIWLPKAHPVAPAPASALLSGVLTKSGIYGALAVSCNIFLHDADWGLAMLLFGVVTMLLGAVLAVFSIDLKRTLACSSMSQIGFILVGIGMQGLLGDHNALAVRGTLLHMVNHSLIKLVLFMVAGVVYLNLHALDLGAIRGFGRGKPLLMFIFLMGALSIGGVPLWSGYISKTLLHESIVEYIWLFPDTSFMGRLFQCVEGLFTLSGGLTAAYMTKLFVCIFVEKNSYSQDKMDGYNGEYMTKRTAVVLGAAAFILPVLGLSPGLTMDRIADLGQGFMHGHDPAHAVHYFAFVNLKGALASLTIGAIVYLLIIRGCLMERDAQGHLVYVDRWPAWLDLEERLYRPALGGLAAVGALICAIPDRIEWLLGPLVHCGHIWGRIFDTLPDGLVILIKRTLLRPNRPRPFPDKFLARYHELIFPGDDKKPEAALADSFSYSLLMFGIGACAVLLYVFYWAMR